VSSVKEWSRAEWRRVEFKGAVSSGVASIEFKDVQAGVASSRV